MNTAKERSTVASLEAQRQSLRRELAIVGKQIDEDERTQARLNERIMILERSRRQAA